MKMREKIRMAKLTHSRLTLIRSVLIASLTSGFTLLSAATASAQVVAPMKKTINSFDEKFIVQIKIRNPYKGAQISNIEMFDENWAPVKSGYLSKRQILLGSGKTLTITAMVPFETRRERQIYICHSIIPRVGGRGSSYKGEVCGKYTGKRLSA